MFCRYRPDLRARDKPRRLTSDGQWSISPAWTPAGDAVIYSREAGPGGLFRIGTSGRSAPQRLAFIGENGSTPALSRRGNRLAYARTTSDCDMYSLPLTHPDKKAARPVRVISSTSDEINMDYSPDGSRIAFNSDRSGNGEIWITEKDGSNPVQFTFFGTKGRYAALVARRQADCVRLQVGRRRRDLGDERGPEISPAEADHRPRERPRPQLVAEGAVGVLCIEPHRRVSGLADALRWRDGCTGYPPGGSACDRIPGRHDAVLFEIAV